MSKVSTCVIGAGVIGRAHAEAIARSDACRLVAIADPDEAARRVAERLGVPWYADHVAMLDAVRPRAAIVATPNETHRPVALDCIARGIACVVEKPIASTVTDATAVAAAAERAGVPLMVGHHRRHNPVIRRARDLIREGRLGRLTNATVIYTHLKPAGYFDLVWRKQPGGGPVLINLIHEIDLIRFCCGEIESVQAMTSSAVRGFAVEDTAAVILRLVNGALVTISLSDTAAAPWSWDLASGESPLYPPQDPPVNSHFLSGTEGSLTLPRLEYWRYGEAPGWHAPIRREQVAFTAGDPYEEQIRHLARVVRGDEAPLVSGADGTRTLAATLAVHEAARTGRAVTLAAGAAT